MGDPGVDIRYTRVAIFVPHAGGDTTTRTGTAVPTDALTPLTGPPGPGATHTGAPRPEPPWPGHPRRWTVLGFSVVCLMIVSLDNTILNVALKTIQSDLNASQADMQWAINSYTLAFAGLTFSFGLLADRYGRKQILLAGLVVFGVGSALSAWAGSPGELIATRALMGVGASTIFPTTLSIITNVFNDSQRGKAIGLWSAAGGLGIAIGPVTGGYLLEHWWWGSVFLVNVPFVCFGVVALAMVVPNSKDPSPGRIDPAGVALSLIGIVSLVYGIIRAGDKADWTRPDVLGPIAAGLLVLALFVVVERRSDHPALDVTLFANRAFSAAAASVALVFFALMGLAFCFSYYLQAVREATPLRTGVLFLPAALGIVLGSAAAARTVRWIGMRWTVTAAMLAIVVSFFSYRWVGRDTTTVLYELPVLGTGIGFGLALATSTEAVMAVVPRARAGAGAAINSAVRLVGSALGVAVLGSLLSDSYREHLGDAASVLPAEQQEAAANSIGGTVAVVERIAEQARRAVEQGNLDPVSASALQNSLNALIDQARDAFVPAMHLTVTWGAGVALLGAVVALVWLPGLRGDQDRGESPEAAPE